MSKSPDAVFAHAAHASPAIFVALSKEAARAGIAPAARRRAWLAMALRGPANSASLSLDANSLAHTQHYYEAACLSVFGTVDPVPAKLFNVPFLGVAPQVVPAVAAGLFSQPSVACGAAVDRLVCVISQLRGLQFAPQVPALASLLLTELPEWEAAAALEALLRSGSMIMQSRRHEAAFLRMFRTLIKSYFPRLSAHVERLGAPVRRIFASWFRNMFAGYLPPADVARVIDAYLFEGPKVLVRYGLALLKMTKRRLKTGTTVEDFDHCLRQWVLMGAVVPTSQHTAVGSSTGTTTALSPTDSRAGGGSSRSSSSSAGRDSDSGGADESPDVPYSFDALSTVAFTGLRQLSRGTISKLMARFEADMSSAADADAEAGFSHTGRTPPSAAAVNAGGGADTTSNMFDESSIGGGPRSPSSAAKSPSEASMQGVASPSLGHSIRPPASTAATSTTAHSGHHISDGHFHVPKVVGIACRLVSKKFEPPDIRGLRARLLTIASSSSSSMMTMMYAPLRMRGDGATALSRAVDAASTVTAAAAAGIAAVAASAAANAEARETSTSTVKTEGVASQQARRGSSGGSSPATAVFKRSQDSQNSSNRGGAGGIHSLSVQYSACLTADPHLATLCAMLPVRVHGADLSCVYSSDVHGSALTTLYARVGGLGPVLVLLQVERAVDGSAQNVTTAAAAASRSSRGASASPAWQQHSDDTHAYTITHADMSALAASDGTMSTRITDAFQTPLSVIGFCTQQGLRGPASVRRGGGSASGWYGTSGDFMLKLRPDPYFVGASASASASTTHRMTPSASATEDSTAPSSSTTADGGHHGSHAFTLSASQFALALPDRLVIGGGGDDIRVNTPALSLSDDLQGVELSPAFLASVGLGSAVHAGESTAVDSAAATAAAASALPVKFRVLALEAFAFVGPGEFAATPFRDL